MLGLSVRRGVGSASVEGSADPRIRRDEREVPGVIGSRWVLLVVAAALVCACAAPAGALGAVGELTFDGCIGGDLKLAVRRPTQQPRSTELTRSR